MGDIAFAAGFPSIRTFNDTVLEVFAMPPTELRRRSAGSQHGKAGRHGAATALISGHRQPSAGGNGASLATLSLRLPFRSPMCPDNLFGHLAATAIPGVEEWRDGAYRRTLRLPHGHGVVSLAPGPEYVACQLGLSDLRDLAMAISRCRRLLDLDADPVAVCDLLRDDGALGPLIDKAPGRRIPRTVDAAEFAIRAVIGQQVSTAAARTHGARLARRYGEEVKDQAGGLTRLFPDVSALAEATEPLAAMPASRQQTLLALARSIAGGHIDLGAGADWQLARSQLSAVPGLGPWSVEQIAMRGLGDPDAFTPTDLGVRQAAAALGMPASPAALTRRAAAWRPWRGYAVQYLWATSDHAINKLPAA
jgi:AraC family transcriptional regulator of adaptative response / DNA-3-methyladenine glycosylase II